MNELLTDAAMLSDGNRSEPIDYRCTGTDVQFSVSAVNHTGSIQNAPMVPVADRQGGDIEQQASDDRLFFTHIREAVRILRG